MIGKAVEFLIVHATLIVPVVLVVLLIWSETARAAVRVLLRLSARLLLLAAVVALVYDGTRTLAGAGLVITSLGEHWQSLAPQSLDALRSLINRLYPLAWEGGATRLLRLPAWLVIGVLGMLLAWIGRKRHPVNVFVN